MSRAHPHACGENMLSLMMLALGGGSSPRVRGKRASHPRVGSGAGLIPARAGKTSRRRQPPAPYEAHPRSCGESSVAGLARPRCGGSSPRVRGKRPAQGRGRRGRRPHPRACGENQHVEVELTPEAGSSPRVRGNLPGRQRRPEGEGLSPRVRGKPGLRDAELAAEGLIPACAGKTFACELALRAGGAHPRACGEN